MRKILLVDDDAGVRDLYTSWHDAVDLAFRGRLGIETAPDLDSADDLIHKTEYDLIIVDVFLIPGGLNGTVEWIKRRSALPDFPPIIGISNNQDVKIRQKILGAGAKQFFLKDDIQAAPGAFFKIAYNVYLSNFYGTQATSDGPDIQQ